MNNFSSFSFSSSNKHYQGIDEKAYTRKKKTKTKWESFFLPCYFVRQAELPLNLCRIGLKFFQQQEETHVTCFMSKNHNIKGEEYLSSKITLIFYMFSYHHHIRTKERRERVGWLLMLKHHLYCRRNDNHCCRVMIIMHYD